MSGLLLGTIQFQDREVPDIVPWGGKQMLAIHRQIGGTRVIDAMGPDPNPIKWAGKFYGTSASSRARAVDAMRQSGSEQTLIWGSFSYVVVVKDFAVAYKHEWEQRYTIECEVVSDGPIVPFTPTLTATIFNDFATLANPNIVGANV